MRVDEFDPEHVSQQIQSLSEVGWSYKSAFEYATRDLTTEQTTAVVEYEWDTFAQSNPTDLDDGLREYQQFLKQSLPEA